MTDFVLSVGSFGYRPDPPKKASDEKQDFDFGTRLAPLLKAVHSNDIDFRDNTTESRQYKAGSCSGNATADAIEILNSIEGLPHVELSRSFVYGLARNFMDEDGDGRSDIDKDKGAYLRLCFEVLSKFGICEEELWPYDLDKWGKPKNLHTLPSIKAMRRATGHRIHSYYRISAYGDNRLDEILSALRSNHPVVFGTQINDDFTKLRSEGPVGRPVNNIVGGHAMIVVGYLTGLGFIIKNSWGKGWGDNGCCIMRPEYLSWSGTQDLWVPTQGKMFK